MKIIHCADLHLDSKMETHLEKNRAGQRKRELVNTFTSLLEYAKNNGVKVVMICGDLFDTYTPTKTTVNRILAEMGNASDIDFLYLNGNHDEHNLFDIAKDIPENVKCFNKDWTYYTYGDVVICGTEIDKSNAKSRYLSLGLNKDKYNIVMMHGQITEYSSAYKGELIDLSKLKGKNINYLALGHIHKNVVEDLDERGIYAYSGCLEGRGYDEDGEKGFYLLDIDGGELKSHEFITELAKRRCHVVEVDITGLSTYVAIKNKVKSAIENIPYSDLVEVVLIGKKLPELTSDIENTESDFLEWFSFKIKDKTGLYLDPEKYSEDTSLKGEFIRLVKSADIGEEEKDAIIALGVNALHGEITEL